ncbi:MAG: PARP-type zinc finger-containing protein [Polyangiaceae bacterium]
MAHTIEVAKSGRAGCRSCRNPIAKGELRFGEETVNAFSGEGDLTYRWHHLKCAASKLPTELKSALETFAGEVPNRAEIDELITKAEASRPPPYPHADRAPTGRAKCLSCSEPLAKGSLRVAIEREIERGMTTQKGAGYLHPACAAPYMETQDMTHEQLTEALRKNTRGLSDTDLEELFSQV